MNADLIDASDAKGDGTIAMDRTMPQRINVGFSIHVRLHWTPVGSSSSMKESRVSEGDESLILTRVITD